LIHPPPTHTPFPYTTLFRSWGDTGRIYPAIREVKANGRADLIVVSMHGGTEYVDTPPKHMQDLARGLVDAGADLVLAHHPHVLRSEEHTSELQSPYDIVCRL